MLNFLLLVKTKVTSWSKLKKKKKKDGSKDRKQTNGQLGV